MDFLFSIPPILVALAGFYALDRKDERNRKERQTRETETQRERTILISRIQAPEATAMFAIDQEGLDGTRFDDDKDFNAAMEMAELASEIENG